jgi:aerobic carbon-monoxide dehydrogenase medium subunit
VKPPVFAYHRPASLDEALATLAELGGDAKVLAGGQSLVPVLNMRLAAPAALVDINKLAELSFVHTHDHLVRVGALARHARTERDEAAFAALPLLRQATRQVAHPTIRNRGTTVGSIVHADPAAEMPAVLLLCGGSVELASAVGDGQRGTASGRREVAAADFFLGPLDSDVRPGELAVAASFPVPTGRCGSAWLEVSRRAGDYALCGVGVLAALDADSRVRRLLAAYISVGPTPVLVDLTEAVAGQVFDAADLSSAAALAQARIEPDDDIHATADYRRHLAGVLTRRAAAEALARAGEA